ncbi:hypothetical protein JG688_00014473 [Phytophthora aleatoria]|uniref:Uncharacterized protein n=1 Tax=Phytophthora aleatoria TaxID=2496075 RepID=A0A8J5MDF5_9STRA|nr:hypothetical protein JG688_00014473 [Phytophthora aleatoria]
MDTAATAFAVVSAIVAVAIAVAAYKRALASGRENVSTFPAETLERVLKAPGMRWFNKMLRCDNSFILACHHSSNYGGMASQLHHNAKF